MSDLDGARQLWLVEKAGTRVVLARASDGLPDPVVPPPPLFRLAYVSLLEAEHDGWSAALVQLNSPSAPLAAKLVSPDGPPTQLLLLFGYLRSGTLTFRIGSRPHHSEPAIEYLAVGPNQRWSWEQDLQIGQHGYFLIGSPQASNVWRILRAEPDHLDRYFFTVMPVALPHGLPAPNFDPVPNVLRRELMQHWHELERAVLEHRSYALVTAAKNIGEALLYWKLGNNLKQKRPDMGQLLPNLRTLLDDKATRTTAPFSQLDYHLLSTLRLMHDRTHPEHATRERLTPELAMTAAQDIVAVVRSLKLAE